MNTRKTIKADTYRVFGGFRWKNVLIGFLLGRTFRPVVTMRLCQAASQQRWGKLFLPMLKVGHGLSTQLAGMDLPWQMAVGPGFKITHGWGLVISPGARIGANVTVFHGVTLGSRHRISADGQRDASFPIIEDEVWIGPHACIVGGITIGQGSRIAAGSFVTENVPPYSTVMGNPAVVVKRGCHPDVARSAPLDEL